MKTTPPTKLPPYAKLWAGIRPYLKAMAAHRATDLYVYLLTRQNPVTGQCDPAIPTIAADLGCDERTVKNAKKLLMKLGVLGWVDRTGKTPNYFFPELDIRQGVGTSDAPTSHVGTSDVGTSHAPTVGTSHAPGVEQRPQRLAAARAKFCEFAPPDLLSKAEQRIVAAHDSQANAVTKINEWWADPAKPFSIIYGPPGTGKTHLASRIFWFGLSVHDYRNTDCCEFREEVQIIEKWRAAASRHKSYRGGRLARAGLLVIDDFGQHEHNSKSHELFYGILNHRYTHNLKTVITTNLEPPKLMQAVGSKLASRLFDREKRVLVKVDGPDYRLTGVPRLAA